jgi:hypothetical protein
MIKRRQAKAVRAFSYHAQCRALMLKVLTHNIMIIRRQHRCFLRSMTVPVQSNRSFVKGNDHG